jgi:hypothetical protein
MKLLLTTALWAIFYCSFSFNSLAQGPPGSATVRADTLRAGSNPAAPAAHAASTSAAAPAAADTASVRPTNPGQVPTPDEDFNLFLLVFGITFVCVMIGAVLAGSIAVMGFLLILFALISAGVASTGILVGLYRRSLSAGFGTILYIGCGGAGMLAGAPTFWLINRLFQMHLAPRTAALTGACSGLLGGLLLGIVLFSLIRLFLDYCRQKLSF